MIRRGKTERTHGDQDMLLDGKRTGIQGITEDTPVGKPSGGGAADGERQELSDNAAYGDGGIAEEEELVETGEQDGPKDADDPGAEGGDGHVEIIGVGDGGTDLGIGAVVLESERLVLVEVWIIELVASDLLRCYEWWITREKKREYRNDIVWKEVVVRKEGEVWEGTYLPEMNSPASTRLSRDGSLPFERSAMAEWEGESRKGEWVYICRAVI